MPDYIILNPSPNLLKVYLYMKNSGEKVRVVENGQFPKNNNAFIYQFYDRTYIRRDNEGGTVDDSFLKLKKTFLGSMKTGSMVKKAVSSSRNLGGADIVDASLFNGAGTVEKSIPYEGETGTAVHILNKEHPDSIIIAGCMESINGSERIVMFDTDFDLKDALGNDYFIFYNRGHKVEVCSQGNRLITLGNRKLNHLEFLQEVQPVFKKFVFRKVKELVVTRNRNPWIEGSVAKKLFLINDFSFFNLSLKLPDTWAEKVGKYICAGKQQ